MPTFSGVTGSIAITPTLTFSERNLNSRDRIPNSYFVVRDAQSVGSGNITRNQPVAAGGVRSAGGIPAGTFFEDFYFRTHLIPNKVNAGNILSAQEKTIEVWNAHFENNGLPSITETNTDGIELTDAPTPPTTFGALESRFYTLEISTAGPAVIDGSYAFNTDLDAESPELTITGLRILVWWPRPNWDTAPIERWEWLTDVIESRNGKEQRIKIRKRPRRSFEYNALIENNKQRRLLENLLFAWQSRIFGLPIWTDQEFLKAELPAGVLQIPCNTATRDYQANGLAGLFLGEEFEIANILSVSPTFVSVLTPTVKTWPAGTKVVPLKSARLASTQSLARETDSILTMNVQFKLEDGDTRTPAVETATYQGHPVLTVRPNWAKDISTDYIRKVNVLDFLAGKKLVDDVSGLPVMASKFHWQAGTRAQIDALRAFLFARYGKLVPIWVPTFSEDLEVVSQISSSTSLITVTNTSYTRNIQQAVSRRDIRIELKNGSIFYRRITGSTENLDGTETLIMNTSLGVLVNVVDIRLVSWMSLSRLDADAIEVSWETDSIIEISTVFRSLRDDV